MADEVKRIIMKRRRSGPYFQRAAAFAQKAAIVIWKKAGEMLKERDAPEQQWWELWDKVGYMASRTCHNVYADFQAEKQPKVRRLNNHGEWQRNYMTKKKCREEGCGHYYCSKEQWDDSSLDSEVKRETAKGENLSSACCGHDITQAGKIYCCWCENRFQAPSPGVGPAHANAEAAMTSEAAAFENARLKDLRNAAEEEEEETEDDNYAKVSPEGGYTYF